MKTLFSAILFLFTLSTYSQEKDKSDLLIDPIEQMPTFPGGLDSLWCFLEANFNYEIINVNHDPAKYIIHFYIDTLGQAKGFDVLGTIPRNIHIDSLITLEIFRVMNLMPKWEPAAQLGKKISCWFTIPIMTPYTGFKCKKLEYLKDVEFRPDSSARFNIGVEKTDAERINKYISNNLKWPSEDDCYGRVIIKCIVELNGRLSHFEILRSLCPDFDKEALRVLKEMPEWNPAIKNNKPVRSVVVIPITFRLQ
jgi:TonB family protein